MGSCAVRYRGYKPHDVSIGWANSSAISSMTSATEEYSRNASALSGCPPKIGVNIGCIERGLVVMGCVVDVRYRGISVRR